MDTRKEAAPGQPAGSRSDLRYALEFRVTPIRGGGFKLVAVAPVGQDPGDVLRAMDAGIRMRREGRGA